MEDRLEDILKEKLQVLKESENRARFYEVVPDFARAITLLRFQDLNKFRLYLLAYHELYHWKKINGYSSYNPETER